MQALKQVQADYEKRLRDVEAQREQLLDEMETRENALIQEVSNKSVCMPNLLVACALLCRRGLGLGASYRAKNNCWPLAVFRAYYLPFHGP